MSAVEERQARAAARVDELARRSHGEPPAAADPGVVKQKSKSASQSKRVKSSIATTESAASPDAADGDARGRAASLDAATADPMEC